MQIGECKYCRKERELCDSHSIPNALFKCIFSKGNGQGIASSRDGSIQNSQESGKAKILCKCCESDFNRDFDAPFVNALKEWNKKILEKGYSARYEFDPNHMAQCIASIFWRAAVSTNDMYGSEGLSNFEQLKLLKILREERCHALKNCSVLIRKLYDKRVKDDGGLSQFDISEIIYPPEWKDMTGDFNNPRCQTTIFAVLMGFLFEISIPRLKYRNRNRPGFLSTNNSKLFAPNFYFLDFSPLESWLISAVKNTSNT